MRILVVATKPPCPPRDGGRLALWLTLQGLAHEGQTVALLAPRLDATDADVAALRAVCEPQLLHLAPRGAVATGVDALRRGRSLGLMRHRHAVLETALARLIDEWRPDLVHAEQLQAWANCDAVARASLPLVLRAQNVESALWSQRTRWTRLLPQEAVRLRGDEAEATRSAARTLAITERDADALRRLAGDPHAARVHALSPPFPASLPAGAACDGTPAIAVAGSAGWWPNREALRWMLDVVAPALLARLPEARLHVFGYSSARRTGVVAHAAPVESGDAFPAGAIAAVPLFAGSGIRMRILEAWARGLPVIATTAAAAGLKVQDGRELLLADTPAAFVAAIERVHRDAAVRAALVAAGRDYLARQHDPVRQSQALLAHYRAAVAANRS